MSIFDRVLTRFWDSTGTIRVHPRAGPYDASGCGFTEDRLVSAIYEYHLADTTVRMGKISWWTDAGIHPAAPRGQRGLAPEPLLEPRDVGSPVSRSVICVSSASTSSAPPGLAALKRAVTFARVLRKTLGQRKDGSASSAATGTSAQPILSRVRIRLGRSARAGDLGSRGRARKSTHAS